MTTYYVHTEKDVDGDYEVHAFDCYKLPIEAKRIELGSFSDCHDAVAAARKRFSPVNGCKRCSIACHTR